MFATVYSTLSPAGLATYIGRQYGFADCSCDFFLRGVGDTYLVKTPTGKYILRVYRNTHRTLEHIMAEVELLNALRTAGVSVSYPIADLAGQWIQSFRAAEGDRHAVLFSYAPGEIVTKLSDPQLKQLGTEMALFHQLSSEIVLQHDRWNFNIQTTLEEPLELVRPWLSELPDELTWWLHATSKAKETLNDLPTATFATGYCHYDFLPKNFHVEGGRITLFDFDFFGRGWLVNDLMTFWTQLGIDVHLNRLTQAEADRSFALVLDAYRQHRPISNDELRAIPSLSLAWWCYYMGFHATHDQFIVLVQPTQLKMRTALIRQLMEKRPVFTVSDSDR